MGRARPNSRVLVSADHRDVRLPKSYGTVDAMFMPMSCAGNRARLVVSARRRECS